MSLLGDAKEQRVSLERHGIIRAPQLRSHHARNRLIPRWTAHGSAHKKRVAPVEVGDLQTSAGAEDKAAVAAGVPVAILLTASIAKYLR